MKKKLFNYFLHKVMLKEQELWQLKDESTALLAVIFSSTSIFRRYASGCNMETIYFADPGYAKELFLLLCLDAEKHGDHLLKAFDFEPREQIQRGKRLQDLTDFALMDYLNKEVYPMAEVDYNMYAALMKKTVAEAQKTMSFMAPGYTRAITKEKLVLPEENSETKMIDRAWDRLMQDDEFVELLQVYAKHDNRGNSKAYKRYAPHYDYLVQRI